MSERWLPIPGHEGYEVSDLGSIRSYHQPGRWGGTVSEPRMMRPTPAASGHLSVVLRGSNAQLVHRLVMLAFVGADSRLVRHYDGNPANNRLSNLRYGTRRENALDDIRLGRNRLAAKTHCLRGHEFSADNTRIVKGAHRRCRACEVIRTREYKQSRRAA